eukprot:13610562-Alexandrium_andersonii.AAC.1
MGLAPGVYPTACGRTAGEASRQTHFSDSFPRTGTRHFARQLRRHPIGADLLQSCVGGPARQ